jgi:hypothetical protein
MMNTRDAKVYRYTVFTFGLVGAASFAILQSFWTGDYRWICLLIASGASQAMLLDRKIQHDRLCEPVMVPVMPKPEPEKEREVQYRPQIQSENGKRIRYARFALTRKQWSDLAKAIFKANDRVIRDVVAQANAFNNLTKNWPQIIAEFERLGWVEDGALTDAGRQWFNQFITPLPH